MNELQELGVTLNFCPAQPSMAAGFRRQLQSSATTLADMINLSGEAEWVVEAAKELEAIGRLRAGWDSYGGLPLNAQVKRFVVRVLGWLGTDPLPVPAVVLCSPGTVQLEWRTRSGRELEVELKEGDAIEYVKVSPQGHVEGGLAVRNVLGELRNLTDWLRHG